MSRVALVVAVILALLLPATALGQQITIVNAAGVPVRQIRSVEWALQGQVNQQLFYAWHTPQITFGPNGWPIVLLRGPQFHAGALCPGSGVVGCHWQTRDWRPVAAVWVWRALEPWSIIASHELLEMLVDPYGTGTEICDPVENTTYLYRGIRVSAFVTPDGRTVKSPQQALSARSRLGSS